MKRKTSSRITWTVASVTIAAVTTCVGLYRKPLLERWHVTRLEHDDHEVRLRSIAFVKEFGSPDAVNKLGAVLRNDSERAVRDAAIEALGARASDAEDHAIEAIVSRLDEHFDGWAQPFEPGSPAGAALLAFGERSLPFLEAAARERKDRDDFYSYAAQWLRQEIAGSTESWS